MLCRWRDLTAASVTKNMLVYGAHCRPEDYVPGDMMEFRMGCRSQDHVRLTTGAVPSGHTAASSSPPPAALWFYSNYTENCVMERTQQSNIWLLSPSHGGKAPRNSVGLYSADAIDMSQTCTLVCVLSILLPVSDHQYWFCCRLICDNPNPNPDFTVLWCEHSVSYR